MKLVVAVLLALACAVRCEIDLKLSESGIQGFKYSTGDAGQHSREEEIGADGSVSGSFSYVDANGDVRKTDYKAGPGGFQPSGDIGVDKKTAEEAAKLAALAPKAPVEEKIEVKIPASPFTLPLYALPGIHAPLHHPLHPYALHTFRLPFSYHAPVHFW